MSNLIKIIYVACVCLFSLDAYSALPFINHHNQLSSSLRERLNDKITRKDDSPENVIFESLSGVDLAGFIKTKKLNPRYKSGLRYELALKPSQLNNILDQLPPDVWVRGSYPHTFAAVISQGVSLTGADDFQQLAIKGDGVKIGIIDLQFSNYTASQAAGELPANLVITDYTGTGLGGGTHGTSVAEIVHDMAPNASLYLAKVSTDVQLSQATNDMIAAGVRVIVHSVAWFGSSFYDGTGSLCNTTNTAQNNGVLWVNAAGNQRDMHYLATFSDTNGDLKHDFASGQDFNTVTANAGQVITLILNWDAYPTTKVDYDLFLYNGNPDSGGVLVTSSTNVQNSARGNVPYESLSYSVPTAGTYYVVVKKQSSSTASLPFTLFSLSHNLSVKTNATSITQPSDCASTIAVAATNLTNIVESFSAEGPRIRENGVLKPEISGPDRVTTSQTSSFAGTSAAAPHVGGLAALLVQSNPTANVSQLRQLLLNTARDVSSTGYDYRTGYGRISTDADLDGILADFDNCPVTSNPDQIDTDSDLEGNVCDLDDDNDGLTDADEAIWGTDPLLVDTDYDGLTDFIEVMTYHTNPIVPDSDGDGLKDGDEIALGFNPSLSNKGYLAPRGGVDNEINVADLLILERIALGLVTPDSVESVLADMNSDGQVNVVDMLLLEKRLMSIQ